MSTLPVAYSIAVVNGLDASAFTHGIGDGIMAWRRSKKKSKDTFVSLSKSDRDALLKFLQSL